MQHAKKRAHLELVCARSTLQTSIPLGCTGCSSGTCTLCNPRVFRSAKFNLHTLQGTCAFTDSLCLLMNVTDCKKCTTLVSETLHSSNVCASPGKACGWWEVKVGWWLLRPGSWSQVGSDGVCICVCVPCSHCRERHCSHFSPKEG